MNVLLLFLSGIFLPLLLCYIFALQKLTNGIGPPRKGKNRKLHTVSVIIPARNEELHIGRCLQALLQQDYPFQLLQILVIDDRSEDRTAEVVKQYSCMSRTIELIQIKETKPGFSPKKNALHEGIQHVTGEIIFTTDADCIPGPHWISQTMLFFEAGTGMVAGYNPYKILSTNENSFTEMLNLDYFAMAAVAAACANLNYPVSCTGGNLAYRKLVYEETGGFAQFSNLPSGDDDLFMQQVREKTKWQIRYSTNPQTFVPTEPPTSFKEFVLQRIRYASKGRFYAKPVSLTLMAVYLLNLILVVISALTIVDLNFLAPAITGFFIKSIAELIFLKKAANIFSYKFRKVTFWLTAFLHPLYITIAGLLGQVSGFSWKGENYARNNLTDGPFYGATGKRSRPFAGQTKL